MTLNGQNRHPRGTASGDKDLTSVRQYPAVLSRAIKKAVKWGLMPRNIMEAVTPPKVQDNSIQVGTPEETARFLRAAAEHPKHSLQYPHVPVEFWSKLTKRRGMGTRNPHRKIPSDGGLLVGPVGFEPTAKGL